MISVLILGLFLSLLVDQNASNSYYALKRRQFHQSFVSVCGNMSWLADYFQRKYASPAMNSPSQKYAIYVFDDINIRARNGGLGDRLGGLVTAFLWAVRTNRTFLIENHNTALARLFQPNLNFRGGSSSKMRWNDKAWAVHSQRRNILEGQRVYLWCVNPKPSRLHCALDASTSTTTTAEIIAGYNQYDEVRIRLNRCYLCRWMRNPSLPAYEEMRHLLRLSHEKMKAVDLIQFSGCILRALLWPTDRLWTEFKQIYRFQGQQRSLQQIGYHYRCGDQNYLTDGASSLPPPYNRDCIVRFQDSSGGTNELRGEDIRPENEIYAVVWNGTQVMDDKSPVSPIHTALCGLALTRKNRNGSIFLHYIGSDSQDSTRQIRSFLCNSSVNQVVTISASRTCHIDYDHSKDCLTHTLVHWFALSVSDYFIIPSVYASNQAHTVPSSSFSRSAMMYRLHMNHVYFPLATNFISISDLSSVLKTEQNIEQRCELYNYSTVYSWQSQGNWVCEGNLIY